MLYAIGDLHLSLEADKPMDIFGPRLEKLCVKDKIRFFKASGKMICA